MFEYITCKQGPTMSSMVDHHEILEMEATKVFSKP